MQPLDSFKATPSGLLFHKAELRQGGNSKNSMWIEETAVGFVIKARMVCDKAGKDACSARCGKGQFAEVTLVDGIEGLQDAVLSWFMCLVHYQFETVKPLGGFVRMALCFFFPEKSATHQLRDQHSSSVLFLFNQAHAKLFGGVPVLAPKRPLETAKRVPIPRRKHPMEEDEVSGSELDGPLTGADDASHFFE